MTDLGLRELTIGKENPKSYYKRGFGQFLCSLEFYWTATIQNQYIFSIYKSYTFKCLFTFIFSTNPFGKWKERVGRSNTGFAL